MKEAQIRHLEMIQTVILRFATNSFVVKGWTISLIAALFVLRGGSNLGLTLILSALGVTVFWALDAYYLAQERSYRDLYEDIRLRKIAQWQGCAFSMKAASPGIEHTLVSRTLLGFYGPILGIIGTVFYWKGC